MPDKKYLFAAAALAAVVIAMFVFELWAAVGRFLIR